MKWINNLPTWIKVVLKILFWLSVAVVVIYVIPRIINCLILKPARFEVVGDGTNWLSFWGGYLGAIISAGVAFIILAVQYQQNKNENTANRELQKNVLRHQIRTQRLNDIESCLITYFQSFHYAEVDNLAYQILKKEDRYPIMQRLKELWKEKDTATIQLKMVFASSSDQQELEYQKLFEDFDIQYEALIEDLLWFCDIGYHSGDDAMLNKHVIKSINNYKSRHLIENKYRIWNYIEKYEYKIVSERKRIIEERVDVLNDFDDSLLWGGIKLLIQYEQQEIDKILKTDN